MEIFFIYRYNLRQSFVCSTLPVILANHKTFMFYVRLGKRLQHVRNSLRVLVSFLIHRPKSKTASAQKNRLYQNCYSYHSKSKGTTPTYGTDLYEHSDITNNTGNYTTEENRNHSDVWNSIFRAELHIRRHSQFLLLRY